MLLSVHLHQDTDGWAISGHGSMDQTLLLTQVTESASPEFQMRSNFPGMCCLNQFCLICCVADYVESNIISSYTNKGVKVWSWSYLR